MIVICAECSPLATTVYTLLAYKPTIFGWILRIKLWGSAYMRVVPHSHTLTARVSTAWTITRPLGLCAGVGAWAAGGGTTHRLLLLLLHTRQVIHCNLTPLQHSHPARPSFSQATHELSGVALSRAWLLQLLWTRWHSRIINAQI